MRTDPSRTLALLKRLQEHEFDDSAFALVHHMPNHSIQQHTTYCENQADSGASFRENGKNSSVQHRLEIILAAYESGGFNSTAPRLFQLLAQAALVEVPMRR